MQQPAATIQIPAWLPLPLHDDYRALAAELGEEEAAAWGRQAKAGKPLLWTPEQCEHLRCRWTEGVTAAQIAIEIGFGATKQAVIGKAHRLGLKREGAPQGFEWTAERDTHLRKRWNEDNASSTVIAAELGIPAQAVIDRKRRLGMPARKVQAARSGAQALATARAMSAPKPTTPRPIASAVRDMVIVEPRRPAPRCEPAPEGGVDLMDLRDRHCRWPVEVEGQPMRYCGAPALDGRCFPYCALHFAKASAGSGGSRAERDVRHALRRQG